MGEPKICSSGTNSGEKLYLLRSIPGIVTLTFGGLTRWLHRMRPTHWIYAPPKTIIMSECEFLFDRGQEQGSSFLKRLPKLTLITQQSADNQRIHVDS